MHDGRSQRLPYEGELDGRLVADSELAIPGRDASCLLQKADPALDFVSALVHFAVESRRAAAEGTTPDPVSGLVPLLRDGVRDPAFAQVGADLTGGVRPVGKYMFRPGAGASTADPGDTDSVHHLLKDGCVAPLAGGNDGCEDVEGGVDGEVNLGGQPAARAPQAVVVRLGCEAVRTRPARAVSPFLRAPAACW